MPRLLVLVVASLLTAFGGGSGTASVAFTDAQPVVRAAASTSEPSDEVTVAFTGDVNLGGRIGATLASQGFGYVWGGTRDVLSSADLAVVNLECAVSALGTPETKEFTFRGDPAALPAMAAAGVDIAGLANNHAADFGREALVDTVGHLKRAGIEPVGAGANDSEAWTPLVVERNGMTLGFLSVTRVLPHRFEAGHSLPGVASAYNDTRLIRSIRDLHSRVDRVVVLIHWGVETTLEPVAYQRSLAERMSVAGADVIVGHHPHRVQPVEMVGGTLVAWSLGNFVFTSPSSAGRDSGILRVRFSADGVSHEWLPARIDGYGRPELRSAVDSV